MFLRVAMCFFVGVKGHFSNYKAQEITFFTGGVSGDMKFRIFVVEKLIYWFFCSRRSRFRLIMHLSRLRFPGGGAFVVVAGRVWVHFR